MTVPTLTTFAAYLCMMFVVGMVAYRQTRGVEGYLLGGRSLGPATTALSAGASDMSGWLLLGLPGAVYVSGLSEIWIAVGLTVGAWANWSLVAHRLRTQTGALDVVTLPAFFESRFEDPTRLLKVVSSLVILLFFTFYAASGLVASAKLFAASMGLPYLMAVWIGAIVIVSYTAVGGFLAVSWTDVIQGCLMLVALVAIPVVMAGTLDGADLEAMPPGFFSASAGVSLLGIISLLGWGLGYFGQPHILARFMAIGQADNLSRARAIGMSWMVITLIAAVAVGVLGNVWLAARGTPLAPEQAETVFIVLTQAVFNPWIGGILLAAILSAIMSTIDSQLLVSSSALSEDIYKPWLRPGASESELVAVGRVTVLIIAVIAALIATDPESQVLSLVSYAWAGLGASFGPVVLFALYAPRTTWQGALAGMVTGAVTVVVWKQIEGGWFDLYELVPGFALACLAIRAVSGMTAASVQADVR